MNLPRQATDRCVDVNEVSFECVNHEAAPFCPSWTHKFPKNKIARHDRKSIQVAGSISGKH